MEQGPKTIEELKQWYINRNLPPENVTRFFIGRDYKGTKAFGIYRDEFTGNCIVYKNKADGTRAIRYEGDNEAYAVQELYKKLKSEIYNQKMNNPQNYGINPNHRVSTSIGISCGYNRRRIHQINRNNQNYENLNYSGKSIKLGNPLGIITAIIIFITIIVLIKEINTPQKGYYSYGNDYYYYQNGSWYQYYGGGWTRAEIPEILDNNYSDYYKSIRYTNSFGIDKFEDSKYYEEPIISFGPSSSSSSDYDSNYDWDSGSDWDSDYTDWDSDW